MFRNKPKFKKGATSIYVVVIATLLFSVVTVSFIRIIINETNKTTSDELAQSAYDSALAGVEDAKTALKQYYECTEAGSTEAPCDRIRNAFDERGFNASTTGFCDAVSEALGRITVGENKEVLVKEEYDSTINDENIVQAYTCVIVDNTPSDYRSTVGAGDTIRVVPLKTANPNSVTGVRVLWYTEEDGPSTGHNYLYGKDNKNKFTPLGNGSNTPTPPTLSAQIIQTAETFTVAQFNNSEGGTTNRGTVFLTPVSPSSTDSEAKVHIPKETLISSNNHDYNRSDNNQPQKIKCGNSSLSEVFACVASIELPPPVGGNRNGDTFYLVLSLPYGQPTTTFAVELCTDEAEPGGGDGSARGDCRTTNGSKSITDFTGVQIAIDSTGRANDMYSRVEARVEFRDIYFPFPEYAIQATGDSDDAIKKNFYVTSNCINVDTGTATPCAGGNTGTGN
ncbi:hypothetical protein IIZ77_03045 [Candidatus Saccharibacteria bacterium]|nr:hypothetical protein [Candidatus Saccharibacteria bacterium]